MLSSGRIHMYPRGGKCLLGCVFEFICLVWLGRNLTLEGGLQTFNTCVVVVLSIQFLSPRLFLLQRSYRAARGM